MHVSIAILIFIVSLKWANWKKWREYHASMFFIATGGLLYEYIVKEHSLWKFNPDWLYGHDVTVIVYALFTMPISVLIFLSHFPEKMYRRILYILVWSISYIGAEWVLYVFGRISYHHGWRMYYSFLFDIVMFSVIALHQYFPLRAYLISLVIIYIMIAYFHIPFKFGM